MEQAVEYLGLPTAPASRGEGPGAVPWTGGDVAWAVVVAIAASVVMVVIAGAVIGLLKVAGAIEISDAALGLIIIAVVDLALAGATWWFAIGKYHAPWSTLGFRRPHDERARWAVPAGLFCSLTIAVLYAAVVSALDPPHLLREQPFVGEEAGAWAIGAFAALAIIVTPLVEETFFRGFIFAGLRRRMGFKGAAVTTSLIFALAHVNPLTFMPIFMIGMILAWVFSGTGSLGASFLVHAAYNGVIVGAGLASR